MEDREQVDPAVVVTRVRNAVGPVVVELPPIDALGVGRGEQLLDERRHLCRRPQPAHAARHLLGRARRLHPVEGRPLELDPSAGRLLVVLGDGAVTRVGPVEELPLHLVARERGRPRHAGVVSEHEREAEGAFDRLFAAAQDGGGARQISRAAHAARPGGREGTWAKVHQRRPASGALEQAQTGVPGHPGTRELIGPRVAGPLLEVDVGRAGAVDTPEQGHVVLGREPPREQRGARRQGRPGEGRDGEARGEEGALHTFMINPGAPRRSRVPCRGPRPVSPTRRRRESPARRPARACRRSRSGCARSSPCPAARYRAPPRHGRPPRQRPGP
jgi:hypothetical protein